VLRSLARACTLTVAWTIALGVSSCSLVLDWDGYTGGGLRDPDAADEGDDDTRDARSTVDAPDLDATGDAMGDAPDDVDAHVAPGIDAAPPCDPTHCGGCCTATGFCAGGGAQTTCGTGAEACQDCSKSGQSCVQGKCAASEGGPPPRVCVVSQCATVLMMGQPLCAPVYETPCCLTDGTCGCQVQIPPGKCM
jgi:hypothetical protein